MMKVSIITVCRNAEKYIETALKSVACQTYPDLEYIIIDGASQDRTQDIVSRYSHCVTKFVSEPDGGVYEAMNKGIRLATGDYLYFLGADDNLADERIVEDVVAFLKSHPDCDFLYGDLLFQVESFSVHVSFPQPDGLADHLIADCLLHQASFARASLFSGRIGYFDENYRIGSDYAWFLKLVADEAVKKLYYPRLVATYHGGGMSSDMPKTLAEMFEIQNQSPLYQTPYWAQRRIEKYQKILRDPQGHFGLVRVQSASEPAPEVPKLQENSDNKQQVLQAQQQVQQLQHQLQVAEETIAAMATSKFWKLRSSWLNLKKQLGLPIRDEVVQRNVLDGQFKRQLTSPSPTPASIPAKSSAPAPVMQESSKTPLSDHDRYFAQIREPKINAGFSYTTQVVDEIVERLQRLNLSVEDYFIDIDRYHEYFQAARYTEDFPNYYSFNLPEKALEHYIASELLHLNNQDIYIDIASEGSPVPEIYSNLFGTKTYRQDLSYAPGLNGNLIGGDAANMPLPNGFATKMALHCSLEHFEGTADIGFIKEVSRVLQPGGAVCIIPLYLATEYAILTDPVISVPAGMTFEQGVLVRGSIGWGNRHGRFYDPESFVSRICQTLGGMSVKLYRIRNAKQIDPSCYVEFAALIEKK